jgi:hypothetical protein
MASVFSKSNLKQVLQKLRQTPQVACSDMMLAIGKKKTHLLTMHRQDE